MRTSTVEDDGDGAATTTTTFGETYSFSAAGWLQMYHFGVGQALQEAGIAYGKNVRFVGSSAGALASTVLVGELDFDIVRKTARDTCRECRRKWLNAFKLKEYMENGLREVIGPKFAEKKEKFSSGQLEVYCTVLPWLRPKVFTEFEVQYDLEEALLASCCITPLAGPPFRLKKTGEWVCDGALAAVQPRQGERNTVTISGLYFTSANIRPTAFVPAWWILYPPDPDTYDELFDLGYNDAIQFLVKSKRASPKHLANLKPCPRFSKVEPVASRGILWLRDLATAVSFVIVFRPIALVAIYFEMFVVSWVCFVLTCLPLPLFVLQWLGLTSKMGLTTENRDPANKAEETMQWRAMLYESWRNMISLRVLLHLIIGKDVPINYRRLERFSRCYRVFAPFL